MMDPIYVEALPDDNRHEDSNPTEGSGWYGSSGGNVHYQSGSTFTNINSFNGVLLEATGQSSEGSQHDNLDISTEEIAAATSSEKSKGSAGKEYSCEVCPAIFNNSSNLKSHMRTHTGERPYACEFCSAAFVQSSNLKAHKRIHTGERPFECKECGQTFSRSSHLTGHKRTHTGEKPYLCGICGSSFSTSTHLRNHSRKHTGEKPYTCKICGVSFNQNTSLQSHLLIHTGERPFKCSDCNGAFRSKRDLISHQRLHSQVKPYMCNTCGKCFKTNQYLQKHLKKCGIPVSGKKRGRPRTNPIGSSLSSYCSVQNKRSNGLKSKTQSSDSLVYITGDVSTGSNHDLLEEEF